MIRCTWGFGRRGTPYYYIRKRGFVPGENGKPVAIDSDERVPEKLFSHENLSATERTPRGDVIAANYAARRERELADDEEVKKRKRRPMTLRELGEFRCERRAAEVSTATIEKERQMLDALCRILGDNFDPSRLDINSMERFRDDRLREKWVPRLGTTGVRAISPRTVYNETAHALSLAAWGYARRDETGMRELNLMDTPKIIGKAGAGGARKLSLVEFKAIYEAALDRPRVGAKSQVILVLGLTTWLRAEPLTRLHRNWINRHEQTVTVPAAYMKGPLDKKRDLTLPLCRWAMRAIEAALELHTDARYVLPVNRITDEPSTNLHHTLRAIADDAKVRPFSLHSLRKTAATTVLNHRCAAKHPNGIPKIVGDTILAHAIPQNDLAYYNVSLDLQRDALSVFDELFDEWYPSDTDANVVTFRPRDQQA